MNIVSRYLARQVGAGVFAVLFAFLALFAFFDLVNELDDLGRGGYKLRHALAFVALTLPNHVYELMPIAALIGAIYALAQFAAHSEFTAMRAAGMGRLMALRAIAMVGLVFAVFTALVGEVIAPPADRLAQAVRLSALGARVAGEFRSGMWIKDTVRGPAGEAQRLRFVNIGALQPDATMENLQIFEFDPQFRLLEVLSARRAVYAEGEWRLADIERTAFVTGRTADAIETFGARVERVDQASWPSDIGPDIIRVAMLQPDRMSLIGLMQYSKHLRDNRQSADRYELALWKKIVYPLAVLVMMALALPFGFLQVRAGGIGYKVFAGIMLGILFHFLNGLLSHVGLLNTWPPWLSTSLPSLTALGVAFAMLYWVGRTR